MISVTAKYRDFSVSRRSIICLSLWLYQLIYLLVTDKSHYFGQPHAINVNHLDRFINTGYARCGDQAIKLNHCCVNANNFLSQKILTPY